MLGEFDPERFSGFVEFQAPRVKEAILKHKFTGHDFADWIKDKKRIGPLTKIRQLPAVLNHAKAREVFLKSDINEALKALAEPDRQVRAVAVDGGPLPGIRQPWTLTDADGQLAGTLRAHAYSPEFGTVVSTAMVEKHAWDAGTRLTVETPDGPRAAEVQAGFWR